MRRVIKLIITEDCSMEPVKYVDSQGICSTVAYEFEYNGERYGTYVTIDKRYLNEHELNKALSLMIESALEAYRVLESQMTKRESGL